MTILEKSSSRLVIQVGPIWQSLWRVGMWLGLGLALAFSALATNLTCHRSESYEGSCELTTTALSGSSTQRISLYQMRSTTVSSIITTDRRGKKSTDYHVLLLTDSGSVAIVNTGDSNEAYRWANQFNAFLSDATQRELTLTRDSRWANYAFGVFLCGVGVWLAAGVLQVATYSFDNTAGTLVIDKQLLYRWSKEYPLNDIRDLEIHDDRIAGERLHFELKALRLIATNLPGDSDLTDSIRKFLGVNDRMP